MKITIPTDRIAKPVEMIGQPLTTNVDLNSQANSSRTGHSMEAAKYAANHLPFR